MRYGSVCSGIEAARVCSACRIEKPANDFHRQGKRGRHAYCKACYNARYRGQRVRPDTPEQRARWNLATRYGLTPADVAAMRVGQGGVCAICRKPMARECIDHDHVTGKVRGLLCHPCNIALPHVENEAFRAAAQAYLRGCG